MLEFLCYFLVGGLVVALTTVIGSKGHGAMAAFVGMFPSMTVLVFVLLYRAGGNTAVIGYAKSLIYFVGPWFLYVVAVSMLCDRLGIWSALGIGVAIYVAASWAMMQLK